MCLCIRFPKVGKASHRPSARLHNVTGHDKRACEKCGLTGVLVAGLFAATVTTSK